MTEADARAETYRLSLSLPPETAQRLALVLEELFAAAPPVVSIYERKEAPVWGCDAYFESAPDRKLIETALDAVAPGTPYDIEPMVPTDWVSVVQRELSPVIAGRYFIYGSHDRARASRRAGDIEIDAGQAFGTAHHATTGGCLLALDRLFKRHAFRHVLDLGTGTGLLAIASARSLKRPVLASDIDPIAVRIARENAVLNEAGTLVTAIEADGLNAPSLRQGAPYDLLIANILAAPLRQLAGDMRRSTRRGSRLVLSGLLGEQSPALEAHFRAHGFRLEWRFPLEEWMTLVLKRV